MVFYKETIINDLIIELLPKKSGSRLKLSRPDSDCLEHTFQINEQFFLKVNSGRFQLTSTKVYNNTLL